MRKTLLSGFLFILLLPQLAVAQDRVTLGFGRFFSNDAIGDGDDRWRTGSYSVSMIRGQSWKGVAPTFGELLEFRVRTEIIAPANLSNPSPTDRRYVGALSLGVHTYTTLAGAEARLGLDLVATGPQTGVGRLQRQLHKLFGMTPPGNLGAQISNKVYPTLSAELGRDLRLTGGSTLHPFIEAQAGVEDYVRVGGDLVIGRFGAGALMLRDPVTGHRYIGVRGAETPGVSFVLGGDVARVFDSAYLPTGGAVALKDTRSRLRAGLHWRGEKSEVFYGITRLSREYETQPSGQTVGSLRLRLRF